MLPEDVNPEYLKVFCVVNEHTHLQLLILRVLIKKYHGKTTCSVQKITTNKLKYFIFYSYMSCISVGCTKVTQSNSEELP